MDILDKFERFSIHLNVNKLDEKAHLRDSIRMTRSLKDHLNRETLPSPDNYHPHLLTIGSRATLDELHLGEVYEQKDDNSEVEIVAAGFKFGWVQGVLIRCLLNIWGVMLFLRLSWVVGQAGILQAILIVLLATAVTIFTSLSMSAISTNGQIKGGGTYYMISRSLGPEFGGAIGIIFALANSMGIALHTVGFCEALSDMLKEYFDIEIVDGGLNDIRIIGSITLVVLGAIVAIGMEWEAKAQLLFMGILIVALANFIVGSIMGPTTDDELSKGFIGYNLEIITTNFEPDYRVTNGLEQSFFTVFAIFFPAATGILAGANISGDLRNPSEAIPKGTILAIITTSFSYILFAIIAGATTLRDATGDPANYTVNGTVSEYMKTCENETCEWGLQNSYQVMTLVSAFGPLNYAGCFAATLSSALACFVSAPKIFQALCNDKIFPYLHFFGKGYGKNQEPLRAYALAFAIALACILIAELNTIAPLITNCFLASYSLINLSTFHVDLLKPVGWRPTFRYYNKWLSLLGFGLSVAAMFLCSWPTALVTSALVVTFFFIVRYRKPDVNWGSSTQVQVYKAALSSVQQFSTIEEHIKTYTPQILVMTGLPNMRPSLVDFAYLFCKNNSLMICGDILKERQSHKQRTERTQKSLHWLRAHKTKSFYSLMDNISFPNGVGAMLQATGVGKMKPNILLIGYQSKWKTSQNSEIDEYFTAINTALEMHIAVTILRVEEGLDYTGIIRDFDIKDLVKEKPIKEGIDNPTFENSRESDDTATFPTFDTAESIESQGSEIKGETKFPSPTESAADKKKRMKKSRIVFKDPQGNELPDEVQNNICRFRMKQKRGTIDVWWLYDDGGLSMLLPHILTTRSNWAKSKLRVFCLADDNEEQLTKQKSMRLLLEKFRIPVSDVVVIHDMTHPPSKQTKIWFDNLTSEFVRKDDDPSNADSNIPVIKESELLAQKHKTFNFMRLRELLLQNSLEANLVVMTLPISQKGIVSGPLYMCWLETLTASMPPFLLVRGNHTSVLTFHS
ncbi:bumetanide-sensitive sodium-(potassium)-chloride cotransporter-like isoform X2 [Daphnia pulicaria]|uniref:bumetanide-sensitive sodium-(potassium)-chloride cotransporter-like isoform X2 n=1 Tax=Daphnia pulicaria TaxID=35523 RepID=UPI001EEB653E|nr:bumetanide-sensitive sodium-(potassium)-chloride cotransporter-like isoform X2 [Daphnia pulicaria]